MRYVLFLLALFGMPAWADAPCGGVDDPCVLPDGRSYHLRVPDGWDGTAPLPVLLHFHGWARQGDLIIQHGRIASATTRRGVLLVAPNGANRTWNFWQAGTADVPFADAVLADVQRRYPVESARVYVSGYSFGAAMAWRHVCQSGFDVAALLAISGTLPQDVQCTEAPAQVRHVHGLADTVMDFPMGPGGDTSFPVQLWRDIYGCAEGMPQGDWQARSFLTFTRTMWSCDGGVVTLDVHPGGHFIPHGWIARQLDELLGLPPAYP
ncbi:MAG: PHB depolymerase family esterase [Pseudomonadota bacterium]